MYSLSKEPEEIGVEYFRRHTAYITGVSLLYAGALIGGLRMTHHFVATPVWFVFPLIKWPFSMRTQIGKWWWSCWVLATLFGAAAINLHPHRTSVLFALAFGVCGGIGTCLCWRRHASVGYRRG